MHRHTGHCCAGSGGLSQALEKWGPAFLKILGATWRSAALDAVGMLLYAIIYYYMLLLFRHRFRDYAE